MPDSSEKPLNKSIFADCCEVSLGKFLPYIKPAEASSVLNKCDNKFRQNIITCKDEFLEAFINEVNGLEFNVNILNQSINLPLYIPIFDFKTIRNVSIPKSIKCIGISLKDIIKSGFYYKAGRIHEYPNISYRESLLKQPNLKDKKVILFLCGEDTIIEGVWHKRNKSKLFETLREMEFYAITGFNFSVFGDECALAQNLNLKRSLYSSYLLEQSGINTIPHVYALNKYQINRWIDWFRKNPTVKCFTINCQFQRSKKSVEYLLNMINSILFELTYLHVILQGFQFNNIHNLQGLTDRIHFADKKPVKYLIGYRSLIRRNHNSSSKNPNRDKLLRENIFVRKRELQIYKNI